jgi:hypothetical protein
MFKGDFQFLQITLQIGNESAPTGAVDCSPLSDKDAPWPILGIMVKKAYTEKALDFSRAHYAQNSFYVVIRTLRGLPLRPVCLCAPDAPSARA